jgi:hypothetical protein
VNRVAQVNGIALAGLAAGTLFVFSGIKGKSITQALQAVIQGKNPATAAQANPISGAAIQGSLASGQSIPGVTVGIPAGVASAGGGSPSANKALGLLLATAYGWGGPGEWPYLESGWQEESGWSQVAANVPSDPYNHAYGIPQANPGSKMASAGSDWKTSPATQIKWGLGYIKATYGSPSRVPGWTPNGPAAGYTGY